MTGTAWIAAVIAGLLAVWAGIHVWRRLRLYKELRAGIEEISGNFSLWDRNDRLLAFNARFKADNAQAPELCRPGLSFTDFIRRRAALGLLPEAEGDPEAWIADRLALREAATEPFEVRLPNDRRHLLHERRTATGGRVTYGIDITDRVRAEEALQASEQRFLDFATAAADWFWESDEAHRIAYLSHNFERVTGLHPDSALGKRRDVNTANQNSPEYWQAHMATLDRHEPFRDFTFQRRLPGERAIWISISGVPVFAEDGAFTGYRGVGRDVTAWMLAREAQELSEAQSRVLAASERNARLAADTANQAKSEFLASMSHEFRTPLNAIMGFGQMLQLDKSRRLSAEQREYASLIVGSGQHLLELVSEVLDLATIESGRLKLTPKPVDVAAMLDDVHRTMSPIADAKDVRLGVETDADVGAVFADPQRLRQVLLNLASNAIKYNRTGGRATISASVAGDGIRIEVADTGQGIPADRHGQVFQPFNRLGLEATAIEGVGIGLSLCKRLIAAMDGQIGFMSAAGVGSTFWIELPRGEPATAPIRPAAAATANSNDPPAVPSVAGPARALLYIDENPSNGATIQDLISNIPNLTIQIAPSALLGLELATVSPPDLIVFDLDSLGAPSIEIANRLRAGTETRNIPIIVLASGPSLNDSIADALPSVQATIVKPIDVRSFRQAVITALEHDALK